MAKFEPTWESLANYQVPDWFRNAKFGLWAHWGPQCQPARGDWYARGMYLQGNDRYREHLEQYDHPSRFGFKEVINHWKAEHWDPKALMSLYKKAGAEYFVALANHHDNFDLWDSSHQPWNSTAVGPRRNIIAEWAEAAAQQGLPFGVSVHASHAWSWYEPAQGADATGELAGVPYDGRLAQSDGAGTWWSGLDPQDLYAQNHSPTPMDVDMWSVIKYWEWKEGYPSPSTKYTEKFYNRTIELLDKYKPDLIYFDDTVLPFDGVSDVGLRIAAHYYNSNPRAVLNGKVLNDWQRKTMVWDIERGRTSAIEPLPWQTCTCLGDWHYKQSIYDENGYKSAKNVIQTLIDIVSKNGNLLLSVPLRGDGTLDELEIQILEDIGAWMQIHRECIVGTRPWVVAGEGPASATLAPMNAQGFNEESGIPFSAADICFTCSADSLYVITMGQPPGTFLVSSIKPQTHVKSVTQLDGTNVSFIQGDQGLTLAATPEYGNPIATVFRVKV